MRCRLASLVRIPRYMRVYAFCGDICGTAACVGLVICVDHLAFGYSFPPRYELMYCVCGCVRNQTSYHRFGGVDLITGNGVWTLRLRAGLFERIYSPLVCVGPIYALSTCLFDTYHPIYADVCVLRWHLCFGSSSWARYMRVRLSLRPLIRLAAMNACCASAGVSRTRVHFTHWVERVWSWRVLGLASSGISSCFADRLSH